ncbi:hypothetical protein KL942_000744 [Ogataea angusta]|uniref:RING-type E3 ubiquitin transferase n=1 Tax=Pichia angusta TaxID=870730 RepID=A0ABQ7S344_PICAN|nr:hypothetical protein KL942_000744 [Ogataea angusta]KAG7852199.1 hypothetical protein KL940_001081 [Ogataea angusta]
MIKNSSARENTLDLDNDESLCPVCNIDLSDETDAGREQHINNCLHFLEFTGSPDSRRQTNRMLVYTLDANVRVNEDNECVICFEEFHAGDKVGRLECLCCFHYKCIKDWINRKEAANNSSYQAPIFSYCADNYLLSSIVRIPAHIFFPPLWRKRAVLTAHTDIKHINASSQFFMSRSPKLESLWLDEPSTRKKDKVLRVLQTKSAQILHYFDLEPDFAKGRKKSPLMISTPFGFNHMSHLSEKDAFGLDKAFKEADLSLLPKVLKTAPQQSPPCLAVSSFRTSPNTVGSVEPQSRPSSRHYRVNSTSSASQLLSRANSTFTRSTSISTLSSLAPSIQESPMRMLKYSDRLPSIPQEQSETDFYRSSDYSENSQFSAKSNRESQDSSDQEDVHLQKFEFPQFLQTPADRTPTDPPHIRKVPSIGSPVDSRDSSFTFELLSTPEYVRNGRGPSNRKPTSEYLLSCAFSEDENDDSEHNSESEDTLIALNAANISRLSRLSMATELDFSSPYSKTFSQMRLPQIADEDV